MNAKSRPNRTIRATQTVDKIHGERRGFFFAEMPNPQCLSGALALFLVYDEYNDCYICPNNQVLEYSTTNRDGYREYKSCGKVCESCPYLEQCTLSKNHVKLITRHIWEDYMEECEDIRYTEGMKDLYSHRKETIERIFGTAKENHGFRYTQMYGKARMEMKVALTFACMNLKKLAKIKHEWRLEMA